MFTLKLNQQQLELILSALAEQPYKLVSAVVADLVNQVRDQQTAKPMETAE